MRIGVVLLLVGCGEVWDPVTVTDDGRLCLYPDDPQTLGFPEEVTFPGGAGQVVWVAYESTGCLSSSCDRNGVASCAVTTGFDSIDVTTEASWETLRDPKECTDDCGILQAVCKTNELPDGTYAVSYADLHFDLTIPSTISACPTQ